MDGKQGFELDCVDTASKLGGGEGGEDGHGGH